MREHLNAPNRQRSRSFHDGCERWKHETGSQPVNAVTYRELGLGQTIVMAGELDHLSVAIGSLQAEVKNLTRTVRDNQDSATEEHRKVHDIVVATSEAVRNLASTIAEMKPLTDDYREKRAEQRGENRVKRFLWVTGGGLVGALASRVLDLIGFRPHP